MWGCQALVFYDLFFKNVWGGGLSCVASVSVLSFCGLLLPLSNSQHFFKNEMKYGT